MKSTKKYLKIFAACVVALAFSISVVSAILFGIMGLIGLVLAKNPAIVFSLILVAIILGFIGAAVKDLMEWLDKKFRLY